MRILICPVIESLRTNLKSYRRATLQEIGDDRLTGLRQELARGLVILAKRKRALKQHTIT